MPTMTESEVFDKFAPIVARSLRIDVALVKPESHLVKPIQIGQTTFYRFDRAKPIQGQSRSVKVSQTWSNHFFQRHASRIKENKTRSLIKRSFLSKTNLAKSNKIKHLFKWAQGASF